MSSCRALSAATQRLAAAGARAPSTSIASAAPRRWARCVAATRDGARCLRGPPLLPRRHDTRALITHFPAPAMPAQRQVRAHEGVQEQLGGGSLRGRWQQRRRASAQPPRVRALTPAPRLPSPLPRHPFARPRPAQQNEIFRENQFHTWSINKSNVVALLVLIGVVPLTMCVDSTPRLPRCARAALSRAPPHPPPPRFSPSPLPHTRATRHYLVKNEHAIREVNRGAPVTPRL